MRVGQIVSFSVLLISALFGSTNGEYPTVQVNKDEWEAHKKFFEENGYLWIKNFFSKEQVALLQIWCDEINNTSQDILSSRVSSQGSAKNLPDTLIIVPEAKDPTQVCRAEDMLSFFPDLYHLISGSVTAYIGGLKEEPYVLFKDKINFKWPGGGAFLPHQDFPAYEFLGPREHITGMVCIDPATLENGCLQIARDWRKSFSGDLSLDQEKLDKGCLTLPFIVGGSEHGAIEPHYSDQIDWLPLETTAGDLILFTSFIPHYSESNMSNKPRRAMFLTHNKLIEGDHRKAYYYAKRKDPENPMFHIGTPTKARTK